jgi:hypothetical protein
VRHGVLRAGIAAVAVAAAMALAGCGGGDGGGEQATVSASGQPSSGVASTSAAHSSATTSAPAPTATATGTATGTAQPPGAAGGATQSVEGVWLAADGATKVQLVLGKGKAALTCTHLCGGGYTDKGTIAITLTCMDGDMERTTGHGVLAPDGNTLAVEWTNGPTDVFSRTGLPSD